MGKLSQTIFLKGAGYLIIVVSLIFTLDLINSKINSYNSFIPTSNKVLLLTQSETYKLYKEDIVLIPSLFISAPIMIIINIFSKIDNNSQGFYLGAESAVRKLEIIGRSLAFLLYVLLPMFWIIYSVKIIKANSPLKELHNKYFLIIFQIMIFVLGGIISSFFLARVALASFGDFF